MRFQVNLRGLNKEGWQRWVCSRRPIDPETGAYCSGCAWLPPGATQLKPRTPHDEWCRVKDDDEKVGCWLSAVVPCRSLTAASFLAPALQRHSTLHRRTGRHSAGDECGLSGEVRLFTGLQGQDRADREARVAGEAHQPTSQRWAAEDSQLRSLRPS
jgi:hypothetical protein